MTVFKSINIVEDFAVPIRASHYRPTSKSMEIVRAVVGPIKSRNTSIISTYGSGKSISAMIGAIIVESNQEKIDLLQDAGIRLRDYDIEISNLVEKRLSQSIKGSVITLTGFVSDLPATLTKSLSLKSTGDMRETLKSIEDFLKFNDHDRIAIIWDEFGRHLETLASQGRVEELAYVQDLAEWVARRKSPSATLTILLHQEFHSYSGRLGRADQSAWKKIEGRFDTLRIIEDSSEIYHLIADVVSDFKIPGESSITASILSKVKELNLFPFIEENSELQAFLERASPMTPAALFLLPKIAGRVGQSERTIFGFLESQMPTDKSILIGVEEVYRYFADVMRTDIGIGGTHKRFIETESAKARAQTSIQREVISTTTLLHLANALNGNIVGRDNLKIFVNLGSRHVEKEIDDAIKDLLSRKLLIHRKLTDEISVWHGSDIDLRALLREKSDSLRGTATFIKRISEHIPKPIYLASEYNLLNQVTRYAAGIFVELADLKDPKRRASLITQADKSDALVAIVTDGTIEDVRYIKDDWMNRHPYLIVALPSRRYDLGERCLEAAALTELLADENLLGMDPLVERELKDLRQNVLEELTRHAAFLTDPEAGAVAWFSDGKCLGHGNELNPSDVLSHIFKKRFWGTPKISNEQIVRNNTSPQTKSARKRLLLGILERSGIQEMGYAGASSSDASIYRTTLVATGLYDQDRKQWRTPEELQDNGLAQVWLSLHKFYGKPSEVPKHFTQIIDELSLPPYGIRKGFIPILVTAGLRAFGDVIAIRKLIDGSWQYVDDIQPSIMEEICDKPHLFEIEVISVSENERTIITDLISEFNPLPDLVETDLIRAFYDALVAWKRNLPTSALKSGTLGESASKFQAALRQTGGDPVSLLFRALPSIAGRKRLDEKTSEFVSEARRQIERMTLKYVEDAIMASRQAFSNGLTDSSESILLVAEKWAAKIPIAVSSERALDRVAKGILNRARRANSGRDSDTSFTRALSAMLVGFDFKEWDDATSRKFSRELRMRVREIEDAALNLNTEDPHLASFLESKIEIYFHKLASSSSTEKAKAFLTKLNGAIT